MIWDVCGKNGSWKIGFLRASLSSCLPKETTGRLFFLTASLQQNNCFEDGAVEKHLFQIVFVLIVVKKNQNKPKNKPKKDKQQRVGNWFGEIKVVYG